MPRVFVSYVRDDSTLVTRLAADLRAHGIEVWIDKQQIAPGKRWKDEIRKGIKSGDYFIACFSTSYSAKNVTYMNEELVQAIEQLRRRSQDQTWFIPVRLDNSEVPDRDIGGGETLRSLQWVDLGEDYHSGLRQIVRAILPHKTVWTPHEIPIEDGSTLVVVPVRPTRGLVATIGKFPVTNAQFRRFLDDGHDVEAHEPRGEAPVKKRGRVTWRGPFFPWRDPQYSAPEQPVVCIPFDVALAYTRWVSRRANTEPVLPVDCEVTLPTPSLWDFAAFGTLGPVDNPRGWLSVQPSVHMKSSEPAPIDSSPARHNALGISDLIGNVWEWCLSDDRYQVASIAPRESIMPHPEVRGGSFLDNLNKVKPYLHSRQLEEGMRTSHSDLGFRIAAALPAESLPAEVLQKLSSCEVSFADCWNR